MESSIFLNTKQAGRHCGLSPRTLEKLRVIGGGPQYCRPAGRRLVRYLVEDLDKWLTDGRRKSTSDAPGNVGATAQRGLAS